MFKRALRRLLGILFSWFFPRIAFTVAGRVVARPPARRSTAGLQVEAWNKDRHGVCDKLVGNATTDQDGGFLISASADHLKKHSIPAIFDLYFKVYDQGRLIKSTEDAILRDVKSGRTDIVIEVDFPIRADLDEPALAAELGFRLIGTPANGARLDPDKAAALVKVIWVEDGDEVLVHLDSTSVRILDGMLLVSVDLETDQTGRQPMVVALALGGDDQAGLVAVTDELPHGNPVLAARWGRALQAAVWSSLMGLVGDHAAEQHKSPLGIGAVKGTLRLQTGAEVKVDRR